MLTVLDPIFSVSKVPFAPIKVSKGRKYRGKGFVVSYCESTRDLGGWRHTGYGWERNIVDTETAKIWVPELKAFRYANAKYVEDDTEVAAEYVRAAFSDYCDYTVESIINWCKAKLGSDANETEVNQFARRVIAKNHPEINIDNYITDTETYLDKLEKIFAWVITLRTKPTFLYGRQCEGGKPYSNDKYVDIARRTCIKKQLNNNPDYEAAFRKCCEKYGLVLCK